MVSERSSPTFRTRLRAIVDRDGIQGVQNFYGVSRRTVRRWIAGETAPQSPRTIQSVTRRGLPLTGAVIQRRVPAGTIRDGVNIGGQFETVLQGRGARAYEARRAEMIEERRIAIENAQTPSEREMAESYQTEPDIDQFRNWEERLNNLQEATQLGRLDNFRDYYGYDDTWDDWRNDYDIIMGRIRLPYRRRG